MPRAPALALAFAPALALAGCTHLLDAPEARAQAAFDAFHAVLSNNEPIRIEGTGMGGGYSAGVLYEVGRDGTRHARVGVAGSSFEYYCGKDGVFRVMGETAYAMRATACPLDNEVGLAAIQGIGQMKLERAQRRGAEVLGVFNATRDDDGARAGAGAGAGDDSGAGAGDEDDETSFGTLNISVDVRGRVERIEMWGPGSGLVANVTYLKAHVQAPASRARLSANVDADVDHDESRMEWQVDRAEAGLPLSEFEVRVERAADGERVATFRFTTGPQLAGGFNFTFVDEDADGNLSEDDRFTLQREGLRRGQYNVTVWDTWADAPVERRIPGPGIATLAPVLALALALVRARARRDS